jgi:transposase
MSSSGSIFLSAEAQMDTSSIKAAIDRLGRPVPATRRRFRGVEEKIRIVEESRVRGVSVAEVARRHAVNVSQVYAWRHQHEQGLLGQRARRGGVKLLSVQLRGESEEKHVVSQGATDAAREERVDIILPDGIQILIRGASSLQRLQQLLSVLRGQPS